MPIDSDMKAGSGVSRGPISRSMKTWGIFVPIVILSGFFGPRCDARFTIPTGPQRVCRVWPTQR